MILSSKDASRLKELIASDSVNDAIKNIFLTLDSFDDIKKSDVSIKSLYNNLVIIAGNFNNLKNQEVIGILDRTQISVERNRINKAVLTIIDDLETFSFNNHEIFTTVKSNDDIFEFDIFLCFSSKDRKQAKSLWEKLTRHGYSVFMSEEVLRFDAGTSFIEKIEFALENSQHFLLFFTSNSLESAWVKTEYETFFNEFYLKNKINRKFFIYRDEIESAQKIPLILRTLQISNDFDSIVRSIPTKARKDKAANYEVYPKNDNVKVLNENRKGQIKNNALLFPKRLPSLLDPSEYIPSKELLHSLEIAISLGQPLLLSGEPGVGKSQFASYISYFLNIEKPIIFNVKSTSSIKELFYIYDEKGHLQYAQLNRNFLSDDEIEQRFIQFKALGMAILRNRRTVLLIDQIDNAPRDFPNDLLEGIERLEFEVYEIGKRYRADYENRPIIIVTTNSEKNLPDSFLSRCVYYHIPFPDQEQLMHILKSRIGTAASEELIISIVRLFLQFREVASSKKPSINELISWAVTLINMGVHSLDEQQTNESNEKILNSLVTIFKTLPDLNAARAILQDKL